MVYNQLNVHRAVDSVPLKLSVVAAIGAIEVMFDVVRDVSLQGQVWQCCCICLQTVPNLISAGVGSFNPCVDLQI